MTLCKVAQGLPAAPSCAWTSWRRGGSSQEEGLFKNSEFNEKLLGVLGRIFFPKQAPLTPTGEWCVHGTRKRWQRLPRGWLWLSW